MSSGGRRQAFHSMFMRVLTGLRVPTLLEREGRAGSIFSFENSYFCRFAFLADTPFLYLGLDVVDTLDKLAELLPKLEAADWIAIDTEADSLHAYPEKLCLIQVSFEGADEIIDPLAGVDLAPLWAVLGKHELIFHGADYDLRLLRKGYAFVPSAIFDTMIAARLVGAKEFGLSNLVSKYLGITLEKGPQKANWARRPLTERMETYARNDTRYLKPLTDILRQQLVEKGRVEWQQESCASLIADCAQFRPVDPDMMWRVKGSHQLNPRGLAVVRELWHWRE